MFDTLSCMFGARSLRAFSALALAVSCGFDVGCLVPAAWLDVNGMRADMAEGGQDWFERVQAPTIQLQSQNPLMCLKSLSEPQSNIS